MSRTPNKKLVSVPDDLLTEVNKASIKENASASKFIEDALKHAIRMNSLGVPSRQLVDACEIMWAYRVLGGAFVPMDVMNYLIRKAYASDKEAFQAKWYESGVWYGKFLKEKFADPVVGFKEFLVATRWDLSEVDVIQQRDSIKFRCVSSVLSAEATELLVKFVDGVMSGMGYRIGCHDCVKGIVALEYKK